MEKKSYGVWDEFFNTNAAAAADYAAFNVRTRETVKQFLKDTKLDASLAAESKGTSLDVWCESEQGRHLLAMLTRDIIRHIKSVSDFALPAHDLHQIFAKDAVEALRFAAMEKPQGYKAAFPIAAMAHDIGRLLEGRLYSSTRPYRDWIPHAQLSFILLDKILQQDVYADMPAELKNHFLYAVLEHSGPNTQTYIARATQVCDRWSGLHGAEGFFRAATFIPFIMHGSAGYLPRAEYKTELPPYNLLPSAMMVLEFFARNMRPDIGVNHEDHRNIITLENIALLVKYAKRVPTIGSVILAPELNQDVTGTAYKKPISPDMLETAVNVADAFASSEAPISAYELCTKFCVEVTRPNGSAVMTVEMRQCLQDSFATMAADERAAFRDTMDMASALRLMAANRDHDIVMQGLSSDNLIHQSLAAEACNYMLDGPSVPDVNPQSSCDYASDFAPNLR